MALELDLPTSSGSLDFPVATPADIAALTASAERARRMSWEEYSRLCAQFAAGPEELRKRRVSTGEPFRLWDDARSY